MLVGRACGRATNGVVPSHLCPPITRSFGIGGPRKRIVRHIVNEIDSVWNDPESFCESFNSRPEALELRGRTDTRRRGGLPRIAAQASQSLFGMSINELGRRAGPILPRREVVEAASRVRDQG